MLLDWQAAAGDPVQSSGPEDWSRSRFTASNGHFDLHVPGVADYRVVADRISITPRPGAADQTVRAFLFGSATGALLHLRDFTVLHGSAVTLPDGTAAVFCGHSTAGKSTLAAALAQQGHLPLADDTAAIRLDEQGQAWCYPGLARTKLWRDALQALGLEDQVDASTRVVPQLDKHLLPLATAGSPRRLTRFYELTATDGATLSFVPVLGVAKVQRLLAHGYRPNYPQAMGRTPAVLRRAVQLAGVLRMHSITRPRQGDTLGAIVNWLQQEWAA